MTDPTDRERIVKLETQRDFQDTFNEKVVNRLEAIDDKVGIISAWVENKSGFIAGILFCVGIVGACVGAFSSSVWKYFTEHHP